MLKICFDHYIDQNNESKGDLHDRLTSGPICSGGRNKNQICSVQIVAHNFALLKKVSL